MNTKVVLRVVSAILMIVGIAMLTSVPVSWLMGDETHVTTGLLWSSLITIAAGGLGSLVHRGKETVRIREGFGIVTFSWLAAAIFGAIPFCWITDLSVVDAVFETMSGFTTTGATILNNIEDQPKGLLYWRSLTQWLGGMGIVVLSLAVLPILGIGGMQLYRAEAPGPTADQLTPRIATAAKMMWGIYVLLSLIETVLLMFGGMTLFDAWCHTCGTMSTGGFSTQQASIKAFDSAYIDVVITLFMFLAGCNFVLHLRCLRGQPATYLKNEEFRFYAGLCLFAIVTMASIQFFSGLQGQNLEQIVRQSSFTVVSILTTTGFCTEDYNLWPSYARMFLLCLMFIGACGGSTGGGMKVSRLMILIKFAQAQIYRCFYPHAVTNVRLDDHRVSDDIITRILGFFFIYLILFVAVCLLICLIEPGLATMSAAGAAETAITASIATLSNIGPGLSGIGPDATYAWMAPQTKLLLTFSMLTGRLEVYTVIVLLLPNFWKR